MENLKQEGELDQTNTFVTYWTQLCNSSKENVDYIFEINSLIIFGHQELRCINLTIHY